MIGCRLVPTTVIAVSKSLPGTVRTAVSSNEDKLYDVVHLSPYIYMVLMSHLFFLGVKTYHLQRKKSAARRSSLENGSNRRGPERDFTIKFRDKAFVNYHLLSDLQILI